MKKVLVTLLIMCMISNLMFIGNDNEKVYGSTNQFTMTTNKKNIEIKVKSATKKRLKLVFINTGDRNFCFSERFVLKRWVNNKWKKVKQKRDVRVRLTMIAWKNGNTTVKVNWKRFFGRNLPKGKYKIKYVRTKTFRIK